MIRTLRRFAFCSVLPLFKVKAVSEIKVEN